MEEAVREDQGDGHPAPPFWSLAFHTRYFPALLRSRMRSGGGHPGFNSWMELQLALAASVILLAIGVPLLHSQRLLLGWLLVGTGAAGLLALAARSIASQWGRRPTFDEFLLGPFWFFVVLGPSVGLMVGTVNHSPVLGAAIALAGLPVGYTLGILSGLGLQVLGWFAGAVSGLAYLAVVGMLFADMIFLSILLFA